MQHCWSVIALCLAMVFAGTGDLAILRRLRQAHGRIDEAHPLPLGIQTADVIANAQVQHPGSIGLGETQQRQWHVLNAAFALISRILGSRELTIA